MKIGLAMMVRNEADVLEAHLEYHLAMGVTHFLVIDHRSTDHTAEILESYAGRGAVTWRHESDPAYKQEEWMTEFASRHAVDLGLDWLLLSDTDEFWAPLTGGNIPEALSAVPPESRATLGQRHDMVSVEADGRAFWQAMVYRRHRSLNAVGKPLPPKVAVRPSPDVRIPMGCHKAKFPTPSKPAADFLEILHYPARSFEQLRRKAAEGSEAIKARSDFNASMVPTWQRLEEAAKSGKLARTFEQNTYRRGNLWKAVQKRLLHFDSRVRDILAKKMAAPGTAPAPSPKPNLKAVDRLAGLQLLMQPSVRPQSAVLFEPGHIEKWNRISLLPWQTGLLEAAHLLASDADTAAKLEKLGIPTRV